MSWDHGYFSHASYIRGYFRETTPSWIDFAALVKGVTPGRLEEGLPFSYLDLGCGTGYGLCMLAALYPEGTFVGVDFLPVHIAEAEALAKRLGLSNIRFLEADFLALAGDLSTVSSNHTTSPRFDYVVSHGVATWVVHPVQRALLSTAAAALRPGGLFYCSYNCLPGWLGRTSLHRLITHERRRSDPSSALLATRRAAATLESLLSTPEEPSLLANALPLLRDELTYLQKQDPTYLSQEYANDGWQPLYVDEFHERCHAEKLSYIGPANFSELFPQLLSNQLKKLLQEEPSPFLRELMVDLATNKGFRYDIFSRGPCPLPPGQRARLLARLAVRQQEAPETENYEFRTSYGKLTGDLEVYKTIEAHFADGPRSLSSLPEWESNPENLFTQIGLLLHGGRLGLDRGQPGRAASQICEQVNRELEQLREEGIIFEWRLASCIGQAVFVSTQEQLMAQGLAEGLEGELLASCLLMELASRGIQITDQDGHPIKKTATQINTLQEGIDRFISQRFGYLRSLGMYNKSSSQC
ncbi:MULTISPECIES: methyltransferase regulatory domain-containing protein [Aphanothece]|uniref:methyltransferase regulatory domain-containing protein n=1 Tax=Aphanothece TaxID=1121 RepID=UPI0039854A6D